MNTVVSREYAEQFAHEDISLYGALAQTVVALYDRLDDAEQAIREWNNLSIAQVGCIRRLRNHWDPWLKTNKGYWYSTESGRRELMTEAEFEIMKEIN